MNGVECAQAFLIVGYSQNSFFNIITRSFNNISMVNAAIPVLVLTDFFTPATILRTTFDVRRTKKHSATELIRAIDGEHVAGYSQKT
jgi:hypothetical protein